MSPNLGRAGGVAHASDSEKKKRLSPRPFRPSLDVEQAEDFVFGQAEVRGFVGLRE